MEEISNPAYQHILINHLPIIGTMMGLLALATGFLTRQPAARIPALVVVLVAGVSAWPVYETGHDAYKPIRRLADDAGIDWLDLHMDRADQSVWTFYAMAGIAALALLLPRKWPRSEVPLSVLTALAAMGCLVVAAWIAEAGGRVRHPEFRPSHETTSPFSKVGRAGFKDFPGREGERVRFLPPGFIAWQQGGSRPPGAMVNNRKPCALCTRVPC